MIRFRSEIIHWFLGDMSSPFVYGADIGVEASAGSRMPLRNGHGGEAMRETMSAPPQPTAIYQRPLKTISAPAMQEDGPQDLPFDSVFPANPWKRPEGENEGTSSLKSFSRRYSARVQCAFLPAKMLLPKASLSSNTDNINGHLCRGI